MKRRNCGTGYAGNTCSDEGMLWYNISHKFYYGTHSALLLLRENASERCRRR